MVSLMSTLPSHFDILKNWSYYYYPSENQFIQSTKHLTMWWGVMRKDLSRPQPKWLELSHMVRPQQKMLQRIEDKLKLSPYQYPWIEKWEECENNALLFYPVDRYSFFPAFCVNGAPKRNDLGSRDCIPLSGLTFSLEFFPDICITDVREELVSQFLSRLGVRNSLLQ